MKKIAIVGSGFTGSVLARQIAESSNYEIIVFEERSHLGGNCYTERDHDTGVMNHVYGPHIFNTNSRVVWDYVRKFSDFVPFINRVKASTDRGVFSFPINLHTINQLFGKRFTPVEAERFVESVRIGSYESARNLEELALASMGRELYETFFYGYTKKQWGCEPKELPTSILKRIPIRFNYNDNYYNAEFQAMPLDGYTPIFERMLTHERIHVATSCRFERSLGSEYDHVFFSGPIDSYFDFCYGRLSYRSLRWETSRGDGDLQGAAVVNYPGFQENFTRIIESQHFAPWERHSKSLASVEYSFEMTETDVPYYPKRLRASLKILEKYVDLADKESGVSFLGRLGTFRYLNMDQVVAEALEFAESFLSNRRDGKAIPTFSVRPI